MRTECEIGFSILCLTCSARSLYEWTLSHHMNLYYSVMLHHYALMLKKTHFFGTTTVWCFQIEFPSVDLLTVLINLSSLRRILFDICDFVTHRQHTFNLQDVFILYSKEMRFLSIFIPTLIYYSTLTHE